MKLSVTCPSRRGNTGDGEGWSAQRARVRVCCDHTSNYGCSDVSLASTFGKMWVQVTEGESLNEGGGKRQLKISHCSSLSRGRRRRRKGDMGRKHEKINPIWGLIISEDVRQHLSPASRPQSSWHYHASPMLDCGVSLDHRRQQERRTREFSTADSSAFTRQIRITRWDETESKWWYEENILNLNQQQILTEICNVSESVDQFILRLHLLLVLML